MTLSKLGILGLIGVTLISTLMLVLPESAESTREETVGTSVIVLVDFSKSFAASTRADRSIEYGLRFEDARALNAVSDAVCELISDSWIPPLKVIWSQIETSSIGMRLLCEPLEVEPRLVKEEGTISTKEEIDSAITACISQIIDASTIKTNLSNYTDIDGGMLAASGITSATGDTRVIVLLSDFKQDLAPGSVGADFALEGTPVVLLHRPGTDEKENVYRYLRRIEKWKSRFLECGASAVTAVPVFAATKNRVEFAFRSNNEKLGTALTVMVDFRESVKTALCSELYETPLLQQLARALGEVAGDWNPPIMAHWMSMSSSGFRSQVSLPIEFAPHLIKRPGELNTVDDFTVAMEEIALRLPKVSKVNRSTDIAGNISMTCSIEPHPQTHILILVSDFVGSTPSPTPELIHPGTQVVMLYLPCKQDGSNPNRLIQRLGTWRQCFIQAGAKSVVQIPLQSMTKSDLQRCLARK